MCRIARENESTGVIPQHGKKTLSRLQRATGRAGGMAAMERAPGTPVDHPASGKSLVSPNPYHPLSKGVTCLSSSSGVRAPRKILPLMKKVGVELTLNFDAARVRDSSMPLSIC
jgi:hypothetical protein